MSKRKNKPVIAIDIYIARQRPDDMQYDWEVCADDEIIGRGSGRSDPVDAAHAAAVWLDEEGFRRAP